MKRIIKNILIALLLTAGLYSCYQDEGNYIYLSESEVGVIEIDTVGVENRTAFTYNYYPGDTIRMSPRVNYPYPENLTYAWIAHPYPYKEIQVGNSMVFPAPDTLCRTLDIDWKVNLAPGMWASYLVVEDTVRGLRSTMKMQEMYFNILKAGAKNGAYILSEYNGQTDIDFYTSALCLIYGGDSFIPRYYSSLSGETLPGKPSFINYGKDYYYAFTEENGYRLNFSGLELMETFDNMFYSLPAYAPQTMKYINECEFLINDGKLHVLYTGKANDRKFSAPIGGDYQAATYLSDETRVRWGAVTGAINADQVIFDTKSRGFRPYFPTATEVSEFKSTSGDAIIDAKRLPAEPLFISAGDAGKTYALIEKEGKIYLYILKFSNVIDNGDLSGNGAGSIIDLSDCQDIRNAKYFTANYHGSAFYYATEKGVYSFSPSSGQTTATTIYECEGADEVTCLHVFFGQGGGGFPSAGNVLWIGVWNENSQKGTLVEFEVDPYSGAPRWQWGGMFAPDHVNPWITTGFGKIKSITAK